MSSEAELYFLAEVGRKTRRASGGVWECWSTNHLASSIAESVKCSAVLVHEPMKRGYVDLDIAVGWRKAASHKRQHKPMIRDGREISTH